MYSFLTFSGFIIGFVCISLYLSLVSSEKFRLYLIIPEVVFILGLVFSFFWAVHNIKFQESMVYPSISIFIIDILLFVNFIIGVGNSKKAG